MSNIAVLHIPRSAPWLPPSLLAIPGGIHHTVRLCEPERKVLRKHKKILVSAWAELYRHVTMSVLNGRWKNSVTPYLAGIMDASFFPSVRDVIICKAPQVGATEAVLNCLGYAIDRDPGPSLCVYPDELTTKENSQDRVKPMIEHSPRLRGYMTGFADDAGILRINLQHMPIYMAWAHSAARLGNKPIRYVLFDETDKYPDTVGKREAGPISLGNKRTITYRHNCKRWKLSTPTIETGIIWKAMTAEAQVVFDYWVKCPACGADQKMVFDQIKWPRKAEPGPDGKCHSEDPATIEAEQLAWYECPHCLAQWNDYDRDTAVRMGQWRERKKIKEEAPLPAPGDCLTLRQYLKAHRPMKIGFHIPAWLSHFVSLSTTAATFLHGQTDLEKRRDFYNAQKAEPWKLIIVSKDREKILAARVQELPPQTVPEEAILLTFGADVQQSGFWFAVRAWAPYTTSWLIHYGFLPTWEDVERIIFEAVYPVAGNAGRSMRIFRACVDTGGSRKFEDMTMTEETYFWLLKNRGRGGVGLWGTKGSSTILPGKLSLSNAIISTPAGKKLPDALRLIMVDTEKAKDQFHYRLQLASNPETRGLPGGAFLHRDVGEDYAQQILAEEKQMDDRKREVWVNPHNRPNHLLDADLLACVCVETEFPGGGLRLLVENQRRQASTGDANSTKRTDAKIKKSRRW